MKYKKKVTTSSTTIFPIGFGGASLGRAGPLVALDDSMNARVYIEVLEENFMGEIKVVKDSFGVDMIFMQDNAPCHKAKIVRDF